MIATLETGSLIKNFLLDDVNELVSMTIADLMDYVSIDVRRDKIDLNLPKQIRPFLGQPVSVKLENNTVFTLDSFNKVNLTTRTIEGVVYVRINLLCEYS